MTSDGSVEEKIKDALASGELSPTRGVGRPLGRLDNDPAWWAKSLLRRERAADQLGEVKADRDGRVALAVNADNFEDARAIIASLNRDLDAWNGRVDEEHRIDLLDEIWLLTGRENARR